jgi:hypothetical protein
MKSKKKNKSYKYGTSMRNYIESPDETLTDHKIDNAKAKLEAETDPWVTGMNILGGMALNYGMQGTGQFGQLFGNAALMGSQLMAMGGDASGKIEAEGEEMIQTADGNVGKIKGPKHEQGGVDLNVPAGTTIYSDRIYVKGKSLAERKEAREKRLKQLQNKIEKDGNDKLGRNTLERTKQSLAKEEVSDLEIQNLVNFVAGSRGKAMFGLNPIFGLSDILDMAAGKVEIPDFSAMTGTTDDLDGLPTQTVYNPPSSKNVTNDQIPLSDFAQNVNTPTGKAPSLLDKLFGKEGILNDGQANPGGTFGNAVGQLGNLISAFGPMRNTQKMRAADTPNINAFQDFGNDALETINEAQGYVAGQRENALKDIERKNRASKSRSRNTSRGVNTMRATDLASDMASNQAVEGVYNSFAQQMMQLLGQEASLENQQDQVVMQGEQQRDLADRQDQDNYYSAMAQNIADMGQGVQQVGKDLNQAKQQEVILDMLNQLSKYGITFDENYKLKNPE